MRHRSGFAAYVLIVLGVIFLLSNLGWLPPIGPLVSRWWPLILIVAGILALLRRSSRNKG